MAPTWKVSMPDRAACGTLEGMRGTRVQRPAGARMRAILSRRLLDGTQAAIRTATAGPGRATVVVTRITVRVAHLSLVAAAVGSSSDRRVWISLYVAEMRRVPTLLSHHRVIMISILDRYLDFSLAVKVLHCIAIHQ